MMNVNFFNKVVVEDDGGMHFVEGHGHKGAAVELRAEMNTLVILNACQHPMDPDTTYRPAPVKLTIQRVPAAAADDVCRTFRPENERGFILTERYFL